MTKNKTNLAAYKITNYAPGRSRLVRFVWYFLNSLVMRNPLVPFSNLKAALLRLFGATIGSGVTIKPSVNVKYPWRLTIGDHCWIGENVWIDNVEDVQIGSHVCLSQGAMLLTGNHDYRQSTFDLMPRPIIIHDGCWIGAQATVCPGVTCQSHAVLAVQSVATTELDSYCIYQGNPATFIRDRVIEQ